MGLYMDFYFSLFHKEDRLQGGQKYSPLFTFLMLVVDGKVTCQNRSMVGHNTEGQDGPSEKEGRALGY